MKEKFLKILKNRYSVIVILLIATLLSLADRNIGYFFGLGIVMFLLWQKNWDYKDFGFGKKITQNTMVKSIGLTIILFVGLTIIETFLQQHFGKFNLSSLDDIRGDFGNYSIIMIIMWVFAALGEELLFRGYYMQGFAKLFGGSNKAWLIAALLISIYFGISHSYQGIAGIMAVTLSGLFFSMIYYWNRNNLAIAVLVHGFYDTIGLTLIYLNKENTFYNWILKFLSE